MSKSNQYYSTTAKLALIEQTAAQPAHPKRTSQWKRRAAIWSRWLHIYLSMASFAILFFFAVTGYTLNHQDWFANQQRTLQYQGSVPIDWVKGPDSSQVDKLEIVESLRQKYTIHAALSDFRVDDQQCDVAFKGPGYAADASIDRSTGKFELTESRMGFAAIVNDLHKGRDSGRAWSIVIDASAILMTLVSASGIVLICFLHRRRFSGLLAAAIGAGLIWFIYRMWVP